MSAHVFNDSAETLDEGAIIAQNVIPVSHFHSPRDMAQAGKDVEKIVLAKGTEARGGRTGVCERE